MSLSKTKFTALVIGFLALAGSSYANFVTNGNFDYNPRPGSSFNGLLPTGWNQADPLSTTHSPSSDTAWLGWAPWTSFPGMAVTVDSNNSGEFIHSIANSATNSPEGVTTFVGGLASNATYTMSFEQSQMGTGSGNTNVDTSGWWDIRLGSNLLFSSATMSAPVAGGNSAWQNQSFTFTTGALTSAADRTLHLDARTAGGRGDILIDSVRIVPEPSGAMLILIAGFVVIFRKRR